MFWFTRERLKSPNSLQRSQSVLSPTSRMTNSPTNFTPTAPARFTPVSTSHSHQAAEKGLQTKFGMNEKKGPNMSHLLLKLNIPVSLSVKLHHAQHWCHDEKHEYRVQQDILRNSNTPSIFWKSEVKSKQLLQQVKKVALISDLQEKCYLKCVVTYQIWAERQWWELQCKIEINLALWGRQRWVERSLILHKTVRKEATVSDTSVLAWHFKRYCWAVRKAQNFLMGIVTYSSHPPVVVVFIFISWLEERKRAVVTSHVTSKTNQHLQQINNQTHQYPQDTWTHSNLHICWLLTFPSGGWTSKKKVLLM